VPFRDRAGTWSFGIPGCFLNTQTDSAEMDRAMSRRISIVRILRARTEPNPGALATAWSARGLEMFPDLWIILRFAGSILVPKCAGALRRNLIGETQVPLRACLSRVNPIHTKQLQAIVADAPTAGSERALPREGRWPALT
jgi:hypothetical protein